jgi:hypothetical protein
VIGSKRQPQSGARVEHHDGDAIRRGENSQGTLRSVCNSPDVRLHTPADVEQQEDVYGHAFGGKVPDGLGLAIHPEHEITRSQTGYRPACEVDNLGIDACHRHVALEDCGVIRR